MRIYISKPRLKLIFWVPTAFLHWKWLWNKILSNIDSIESKELIGLLPILIKGVKVYQKEYGHFDLIHIKSRDGIMVKIRV